MTNLLLWVQQTKVEQEIKIKNQDQQLQEKQNVKNSKITN
jgi:hypothetical protein